MPDVFISYSRKDKEFVRRLYDVLAADQREVWIDWEGIPLSADWWAEIAAGIEGSDAFVFVITPDSIVSEVCKQEIAHAEKHNKRMVPILYREVKAKEVPPLVASLNWIFFRETDDFEQASQALLATLDTDLEWVKAHTRLTQRAVEWEARGRSESYMLRGEDLADAEWRLTQMQKEPPLTELHGEYILASRQSALKRQRLTIGAVTAGLILSIFLGLIAFRNFLEAQEQYELANFARQTAEANEQIAWQAVARADESAEVARQAQATAETERNRAATAEALAYVLLDQAEVERAIAHSRELASDALLNINTDPELSVLLALQALAVTHTIQAEEALHLALQASGVAPAFNQEGGSLNISYNQANPGSGGAINDISFSPNGQVLASAGDDGTLRLWEVESGQLLHTIAGHEAEVLSLAFSPDSQRLVSGGADASGRVWEVASGRELLSLNEAGYTAWINEIAFSPDGRRVATANRDGLIKLWDASSGEQQQSLEGHAAPAQSVAFSPDGTRLASAGMDGTIQLWDTGSWDLGQSMATGHNSGVQGVTFSPDGSYLATAGGDGLVKVWDAASGDEIWALTGHSGEVRDLAFSPDGRRLGSIGVDGRVKVWHLDQSGEALTLPGHTTELRALSFSLDGRQLVVAGADGSLRLYLLDLEALQALARANVTRTLTSSECFKYLHQEQCPG